MRAPSSRPFCPRSSRRVSLWYLSAGRRYTTQYFRMTIYFAIMEVRGSIAGGHAVTLEETKIVQKSPGSGWSLIKAMQLTLSGNTLAGKWEALNQESGGKIAAGEMTLKRSAE